MISIALAEIAFLSDIRAGKNVKIVTMGTSLTDGANLNASSGMSWVPSFTTWLKSLSPVGGSNVSIVNRGVSGASSDNTNVLLSGIRTQLPLALTDNPDVVFIEFSMNDSLLRTGYPATEFGFPGGLNQSVSTLNSMIDELQTQNAGVTVVLQTMNNAARFDPRLPDNRRPDIDKYYQSYRDIAIAQNALLIDNYPTWQQLFDTSPATWNSYIPDGIHPNAAGVAAITLPGIQSTLIAVPEPSSCLLITMTAIGGLIVRRRKKNPQVLVPS